MCHFIFSGVSWISPICAPDPAAPDAASEVLTDVIGDGLKDGDGDGASTALVEEDVTPPSSWVPPSDMASTFATMVGINPDMWGESKRLSLPTNAVVRRLTAPDSGFRPF